MDEILCRSKNYFLKEGRLKNYYIFITPHRYEDLIITEYVDEYCTVIVNTDLYSYYADKLPWHDVRITKKNKH